MAVGAAAPALTASAAPSFHSVDPLGTPSGRARITSLSADGSVAAGTASSENGSFVFSWSAATGAVPLTSLDGLNNIGRAGAISPDGTIVFGGSSSSNTPFGLNGEATMWNVGSPSSPQPLGFIEQTMSPQSFVFDVSTDGSTLVGFSTSNEHDEIGEAARWVGGEAVSLGLGRSRALGVSADGNAIVGLQLEIGRASCRERV